MPASLNNLESILRQVTRWVAKKDHVIVHIDKNKGDVIKSRLLASLKDSVTYELVVNKRAEIYDNVRTVKVFKTNEETEILFRLSVIAQVENAEKIVAQLADPDLNPTTKLSKFVADAILEEARGSGVRGPDGLAADIAANRTHWSDMIQKKIADQIGLAATLIFEFKQPGQLINSRAISLRHVDMRTRDAPHRSTSLIIHVTLEPSGEAAINPLPLSELDRATRLSAMLGSWLPDSVGLYHLWYDKAHVESALKVMLSAALKDTGHRASSVLLEPIRPPVERQEQVAMTVLWKGRSERTIPFGIDAILTIREDGAGVFDQVKPLPRRVWLDAEAGRAINIAMHGRDFEDLNQGEQDEVGRRVARNLERAARATGQDIKDPLLAKVVLPENMWLGRVQVVIPAVKYKTKNDLVEAEFEITLEIQFETLRPLIEYLRIYEQKMENDVNYNSLIHDKIATIARTAARNCVAQIDDTAYYSNFEPWNFGDDIAETASTKKAVKDVIRDAVLGAVRSRLGPKSLKAVLRRVDSNVSELVRAIAKLGTIVVPVTISPSDLQSHADILPVKVTIRSGILQAPKIAEALARGLEQIRPVDIETSIANASKQFLGSCMSDVVMSLRSGRAARGGVRSVFVDFEHYLRKHMEDVYGFTITLEHVEVEESDLLKAVRGQDALPVLGRNLNIEFQRQEMKRGVEAHTEARRRLAARIKALDQRLLDNHRVEEDDYRRYTLDSEELAKLTEQYEVDGMRLNQSVLQSFRDASGSEGLGPAKGLGHDGPTTEGDGL